MKYSIVNGKREEAFPAGKGICELCLNETIAKCGRKKINHWAHKNLKECDPWWENETPWHREWKNHFPSEWQEVIHKDELSNEQHRADVNTEKGWILEFQNSPINLDEIKSRENFYKKLIWIVNGITFEKRFHILDKLPNLNIEIFEDIRFINHKKSDLGKLFYNITESPNYKSPMRLLRIHNIKEISIDIDNNYIGHHQFELTNPHTGWYEAKCNVYFDFGTKYIFLLILNYDDMKLKCVQKIEKQSFINEHLK